MCFDSTHVKVSMMESLMIMIKLKKHKNEAKFCEKQIQFNFDE